MYNPKIMLPWQERSLLCQMFVTCSYLDKVFGTRFWAIYFTNSLLVTIGRNRGRSGVKFNGTLNCAIAITLFDASFTFLYLILANFVLKFLSFRRHGNKGQSGVHFCDTHKLYDIDNPLIGATYLTLCLILHELRLIWY